MIKIASPVSSSFHSFKCGEIFCISPSVYNVTCCICAAEMHLDQFSLHFQMHHLDLAEQSINFDVLECKGELTNNVDIEIINIKEEVPEDDPIKQEDSTAWSDQDNNGIELLKKTEKARNKLGRVQKALSLESEVNNLDIGEKSEVKTSKRKPNTRNSKRNKPKISDSKELKKADKEIFELKSVDLKKIKIENELDSNNEDFKDLDSNEDITDRDWVEEDEASGADSEPDKDDIKDELPYPCHTCKRSYRSKHGLLKHNQIVHNPNKKAPKKPKEPKTEHRCEICNEVFRIARDLNGHRWKHTGIFCDICGKRFTQAGNMMRHKLRHTGIKDHKCEECGKEFYTDKELKSHIICHTKLMPVICEICGKQCRHRGVLTAHMRRHTGERPAKCDVCGKCFFSIHDLNVHAVAHTSERPFKCDICGSTFQRKKALRVHKLIHSKDRKHVCKICGRGFPQSGGLKCHMRSHNAALEKSTIKSTPQPLVSNILENPSSQAGEYSSELPTSTSIATTNPVVMPANTILEQYLN